MKNVRFRVTLFAHDNISKLFILRNCENPENYELKFIFPLLHYNMTKRHNLTKVPPSVQQTATRPIQNPRRSISNHIYNNMKITHSENQSHTDLTKSLHTQRLLPNHNHNHYHGSTIIIIITATARSMKSGLSRDWREGAQVSNLYRSKPTPWRGVWKIGVGWGGF